MKKKSLVGIIIGVIFIVIALILLINKSTRLTENTPPTVQSLTQNLDAALSAENNSGDNAPTDKTPTKINTADLDNLLNQADGAADIANNAISDLDSIDESQDNINI